MPVQGETAQLVWGTTLLDGSTAFQAADTTQSLGQIATAGYGSVLWTLVIDDISEGFEIAAMECQIEVYSGVWALLQQATVLADEGYAYATMAPVIFRFDTGIAVGAGYGFVTQALGDHMRVLVRGRGYNGEGNGVTAHVLAQRRMVGVG